MDAVSQLEILGRLVMAAGLGGLIGLQRELQGYPAGIRTIALVALGSALFTEVSQLIGGDDRVAAGIVTGIGFIGAGVIFREQFTVRGITTAATIWAAAAIGMAVGVELYLVAGVGTVLIFILLGARPITRRMDEAIRRRTRELNEELKGQMTSSDMNERDQGKTQDD